MTIIYHHQIKRDLRAALAYYDAEGGSRLGDRFFDEVEATVARVNENPQGCHFAGACQKSHEWGQGSIFVTTQVQTD